MSLNAGEGKDGDWLVAKRLAIIRIVNAKDKFGESLSGNGVKPSKANEWSGEIYNFRDGHTYDATTFVHG